MSFFRDSFVGLNSLVLAMKLAFSMLNTWLYMCVCESSVVFLKELSLRGMNGLRIV